MSRPSHVRVPRLPAFLLAVFAVAFIALAFAVYHAVRLREEALDAHRVLAQNVARTAERELAATLHMLDRITDTRAQEWREGTYPSAAAFEERLQGDLTGLAALRSFSVVADDGSVLVSTVPGLAGKHLSSAALAALRAGPEDIQLHVSGPWRGRDLDDGAPATGELDISSSPYFFTVMRHGEAQGQRFTLSVTLNPDFFAAFCSSMVGRPDFLVELYRYDGLLLVATEGDPLRPGHSAARDRVFAQLLADREIGLVPRADEWARQSIVAYHASRSYPLVAQVRLPYAAVLAGWRVEVARLATATGIALGSLLLLAVIWYRQQRRRLRERAAAQAEIELAARVFDAAWDCIVITDAEQRILRVNRAYTSVTGYREDEVRGRPAGETALNLHDEPFYQLIRAAAEEHGIWDGEALGQRKNGDAFPVHLTVSVARDGQGHVANYIATFSDITARKRAEAELRAARDTAESASLAKSRFLATMSHEIRTPMNGILGMAQLLLMPRLTEAERMEYARTVLSSGETLLALLNDILDLSKVEAGRLELQEVVFDPAELLREAVQLFSETAQQKRLRLDAAWHGETGLRYRADPVRLRQMLTNLVSNALKFTHAGEVRIEAEPFVDDAGTSMLRFTVRDTGIGVAHAQRDQLFQPFTQLDNSLTRSVGGTGLGLSIVRSLAQLMGGEAGVQSEPGRGSDFWFTARALPAPDAVPARRAGSASEAAAPRRLRGRVLVVEDVPANRHVIEAMLQRLGVEFESVENGALALDRLTRGTPPGLVLMDCRMPVLDGLTATERLREWEGAHGRPRVPVVALTANAFPEDRADCERAGMDDFVAKPVRLHELRSIVERWLGPAPASAPPTEAEATADTFDRDSLLARNDGDFTLAQIAAQAYMTDGAVLLDAACRGVETAETPVALERLATLRAAAGLVCGHALAGMVRRIEAEMRAGQRVGAVALLGPLRQRAAELDLALAEFIGH